MTTRETMATNTALKQKIAALGLRSEGVWQPTPHDPEGENRQLQNLLTWIGAYRETPDRRALERRGFQFPPVKPCLDPDSDWERFARWMDGRPVRWCFTERFGAIAEAAGMTDAAVDAELDRIEGLLEGCGVLLDTNGSVPPRLLLGYLGKTLAECHFDFAGPGSWWHLDGCGGCCPDCFQRPWCDTGACACWPEDEAAGGMVIPEHVRPYVTAPLPGVADLRAAERPPARPARAARRRDR
jgi:hypothetical protein